MLELLFAMLLLTIVILGMVSVLASLIRYQSDGRNYEKVGIAGSIVFGKAGLALAENFERPLVPDLFELGRQPLPELEGLSFQVVETKERDDLKRVELTIFWTDESGVEREKTMSTKFVKER